MRNERVKCPSFSVSSWVSSGHEGPIHVWDAFTGNLRCSYRGYNNVDQLEAAISVTFSIDGQSIFCGYKKNVKIFSTSRPGREYVEYAVTHPASCITVSSAQPGVLAIGKKENCSVSHYVDKPSSHVWHFSIRFNLWLGFLLFCVWIICKVNYVLFICC